ncbi:hypothetical protein LSH36_111g03009 [Paralvinella palmiformis]|uniref:28S ribosomal protein S18a, mitochondrial n=1 Tax=Paralvinella palmiformis TaxID=53620 RepID=A0AAD9K0M0_9ANNE|nr:hypothetical protein LSH36_111g03009 [Paralvinella palmiformis]
MASRYLGLISRQYHRPLKACLVNNVPICQQQFSTTSVNKLKEIQKKTEGQLTEIEGIHVESGREGKILNVENPQKLCPLCPQKLGVEVKYTDVLILRQFLRPDGCMIPREVTGLCLSAQRRLQKLVHRAQRSGLLSELRPPLPDDRQRTSHKSNYKWRKYNIFYDDD